MKQPHRVGRYYPAGRGPRRRHLSHNRKEFRNVGRSLRKSPRRAMLGPIVLIGAAILAIAVVAAWGLSSTATGGRSTVEAGQLIAAQPVVDLGRVPFDRQAEARFVLENTGGQPVRVVGAPTVKTLEGC